MTAILVPLDGSKLAEHVLPFAQELAKKLKARVHFIEVVDPTLKALDVGLSESPEMIDLMVADIEKVTEDAKDYLTSMTIAWRAQEVDADWEVVEGRPAKEIVEAACAHQVDMIAMCTHGRSGLGQVVFGSVANEVLRESGLPVLLVRPGDK